MTFTPQRFVHVGFGNVITANRIEAILVPTSANARRLTRAAKEKKTYFDLTSGRTTKALIMMDDGKIIGCALTPRTIAERIQARTNDIPEGEEENEDHSAIRETVDS